ncbi:MAG: alpha/beta hydrolase [Lutibacter sp.]|uniref:alpha/beta hydrolase n=1 Tax=Lutibacter sp. TaxID=1925666 RepID=UPI00299E8BFF|nr:alpha/beta hydrolase [Lutibacter sp.]MDX1830416.1 alpha/beta hydrolase [Lutibacter sp.]
MRYFILMIAFLLVNCNSSSQKKDVKSKIDNKSKTTYRADKIIFPSLDSLPITANFYQVKSTKPMILLCHQAGFSRGEYKATAIKLNNLGYTCLAIDQRSGNIANDVINETALAAKKRNLPQSYFDAKQDIQAAINFLYKKNNNQPIILVGSSYSATLALLVGVNSSKVKAIAAFSPGEYYNTIDVKNSIKNMAKPIFVTSSKKESESVTELVALINPDYVTQFIPNVEGIHGSKALWKSTRGSENYWKAFVSFLQKNSEL